MNRGPVAEIDLSALDHNLKVIRNIIGKRTIFPVVKADAYGHGSVEVARRLQKQGINCLSVAFTGEARVLRETGITTKILVLFDREEIEDYFTYDLIPVIQDLKMARKFSGEAKKRKKPIAVHLKIDTGMGRIGLKEKKAFTEAERIVSLDGIIVQGVMSHFSEADLSDRTYADTQIETFLRISKRLSDLLGYPLVSHMANSAAVLSFRDALMDAVRPGIALYGCSPFIKDEVLAPVMSVRTKILVVRKMPSGSPVSYGRTFVTKRPSRIAVIPVGYADGYSRSFSNNAEMLVRGKRVPVVGRVCMDLAMVDVTEVEGVSDGDEVVVLGRQGNEQLTAGELASRIATIPYEVLISLGSRARREYIH